MPYPGNRSGAQVPHSLLTQIDLVRVVQVVGAFFANPY
jgi:hypothetical protein